MNERRVVLMKFPRVGAITSAGGPLPELTADESLPLDEDVAERLYDAWAKAKLENLEPKEALCGRRAFLSLYVLLECRTERREKWVRLTTGLPGTPDFSFRGMAIRHVRELEPDQILLSFGFDAIR